MIYLRYLQFEVLGWELGAGSWELGTKNHKKIERNPELQVPRVYDSGSEAIRENKEPYNNKTF